ncbi:MAG TPA: PASTA domain-containing protein [Treponemataceae bacterium]|nr:PASTA domain-containing protein [Treponemataceae bacterium]
MKIHRLREDFADFLESLEANGKALILMSLLTIMVMAVITMAVFFLSVKGKEEVMVPNVVGKELSAALLEMQVKELYPKLQMKYSNFVDDKGTVLEQSPPAGSIVKAGRRINLVVSRGAVIDTVKDYVGQKIDSVKLDLQSLFTGYTRPLIVLDENFSYEFNEQEEGTILWQDPAPDTKISDPIVLKVGLSKGSEYDKVKIPSLDNLSLNDTLLVMNRTKLLYDFSFRTPEQDEGIGRVVSQLPVGDTYVNAYSRVSVVFAFPEDMEENGLVYGVFKEVLQEFPYAVELKLEAIVPEGDRYSLVQFYHLGGNVSIPYAVARGTELVLSISNKEAARFLVD